MPAPHSPQMLAQVRLRLADFHAVYGHSCLRRLLEPSVSRILFPPLVARRRATIIYLATTIARRGRATYPEALDGPPSNASLFGLAPCGVCPASDVTSRAVRSYRTISPLPPPKEEAVCFLWHFPSRHRDWGLPSALPWGVRTFLRPEGRRSSGRLEQAKPLYGTRQTVTQGCQRM